MESLIVTFIWGFNFGLWIASRKPESVGERFVNLLKTDAAEILDRKKFVGNGVRLFKEYELNLKAGTVFIAVCDVSQNKLTDAKAPA